MAPALFHIQTRRTKTRVYDHQASCDLEIASVVHVFSFPAQNAIGRYWRTLEPGKAKLCHRHVSIFSNSEVHKVRYLGADLHLAFAGCRRFTGTG